MALKPEVVAALSSLQTMEEIREAWSFLKAKSGAVKQVSLMEAKASGTLTIGGLVSFLGKHGIPVTGTVEKINRTTVTVVVKTGNFPQRWRVSAALLKAA